MSTPTLADLKAKLSGRLASADFLHFWHTQKCSFVEAVLLAGYPLDGDEMRQVLHALDLALKQLDERCRLQQEQIMMLAGQQQQRKALSRSFDA